MYLKRKIDKFLVNWKNDENHLPLIVRGARQVGKTESIRFFAKSNYKYLIEINFVENPQYKGIIEEGFNIDSIIKLISRMNPLFKFIKEMDKAVLVLQNILERGTQRGEFACFDVKNEARDMMLAIEGMKVLACTTGLSEKMIDIEFLHMMERIVIEEE
mgnify:CR=1 FL=1